MSSNVVNKKDNSRFDIRKIRFLDTGKVFFDYVNYDLEIARSGWFHLSNKDKIKFFSMKNGDTVFIIKDTNKSFTLSFLMRLCGYEFRPSKNQYDDDEEPEMLIE